MANSAEFIYGPWLQNAKTDSMTIMWEYDQADASMQVDYGLTKSCELGSVTATTASVNGHHVYSALVQGLDADTIYHYRVEEANQEKFTATMKTAPHRGPSDFRFYALGDSRSNPGIWGAISEKILEDVSEYPQHHQTFVINSGDIAANGSVDSDWDQFFPPARNLMSHLPIYVSFGNHEDRNSASSDAFLYGYFDFPSQESGSDNEKWYSFDFGNAHFTFLALWDDHGFTSGPQYDWLQADLARASSDPLCDWRFATMHFTPWSLGDHVESQAQGERDYLHPLFRDNQVPCAFGGHNHVYCRYEPVQGVSYITTGGAGAGLENINNYSAWSGATMAVAQSVHHYMVVDVTTDAVSIRALDTDGSRFDWLTLGHDPSNLPPFADAGQDPQGTVGQAVELDGSASEDPEGTALSYQWTQVRGPAVFISNSDSAIAQFTPPEGGEYLFELKVSDGTSWSAPDFCLARVSAGSVTFEPLADTYIDDANPDANYGDESVLLLDNEPDTYKTYLRFEIEGVEGSVLSAKLRMYCIDEGDLGQIITSSDQSWDESAPTWNNPLPEDGPAVGAISPSSTGWVDADITSAVEGNGPLTLILRPTGGGGADFHSRQSTDPPQLIVTYSGHSTEPDGGTDAGTDASTDAGTDVGSDASLDAGADLGTDASADAGTDPEVQKAISGSCACGSGGTNSSVLFLFILSYLLLFRHTRTQTCV